MHVVPKAAKPFSEEDEKTTLEAQWEDEPSTTVEQGEVADKIRALGVDPSPARRSITGVTNTNASTISSVEEATVDDQHASEISTLPPPGAARMVITQGNDLGKDFDIDGGKIYSIGRSLENDIVLTDIAVSRKHFDLRFEAGAWVIADNGSGNGTVVNGNLEDNPFMLANGDLIEIGTTTFRFEQQASDLARASAPTFDVDVEEEPSTVAGKPIHQPIPPQREPTRNEAPSYVPTSRPKTLPPPAPLRARGGTQPPAFSLPPPPIQPAPPSTTLPMPQMANRPPISQPHSPTLLGAEPPMQLPTTIPGQGQPMSPASLAQTIIPLQPLFYPQATEIPPHSVHAQLLVQAQSKRSDGSTAHVAPVPYGVLAAQPLPSRFSPPHLTRRAKLGLGLGALCVIAAIATIALLHGTKSSASTTANAGAGSATVKSPPPPPKPTPTPTPVVVQKQPDPPKPTPTPVVVQKQPDPPKPTPTPVVVQKQPDPPKPVPQTIARRPDPPRSNETLEQPKATPKRVAAAPSVDDAREKADGLYQDKRFNDASNVLLSAARTSDGDTARDLRLKAQRYVALGKAYNHGMAPGADPGEAFDALRAATSYDQNVGGHFSSDISTKLAQIAPRAAISFVASGELEKAHVAVIEAEQLGGSSNGNVKAVKAKLEKEAGDIYAQAVTAGLDSADGKDKLKRIKAIVDAKSPWYQKASRALSGA